MQENKISEAMRALEKKKLILIDHARHNDFHIRINPFLYWKGRLDENTTARSSETSDWLGWNDRIEAR